MSIVVKPIYCHQLTKRLVSLTSIRHTSSTSQQQDAVVHVINNNISFRPAVNSLLPSEQRPIVLLYGWMVAKAKHIHKYGDFYTGKGFDVVHIKVQPDKILRPSRAQSAVEGLLDFVSHTDREQQPLLYHGFSVGGYLFGETLVKIHDHPERYGAVGQRLKGQVYDSPVDFEGIPRGFSKVITNNVALQKILYTLVENYLQLFYNYTSKHYKRASVEMRSNRLNVPTLFMYSKSDQVAVPDVIDHCIGMYRDSGVDVHTQCFEDSLHVGHFHKYPVEYITVLENFLRNIALLKKESVNND